MITPARRAYARALAATLELVAVSALGFGLTACSHRSMRDPGSVDDAGAADRLLGAQPWDGLTSGGRILSGRLLYPLAVGNRWDYDVHARVTLVTKDGPQPPQITDTFLRDEITGTVQIGTRTYFLQQETNPLVVTPPRLLPSNILSLRQDRSGLYQREVITVQNPPAVATEAMREYVDRVVTEPSQRAAFERAAERLTTQLATARWNSVGLRMPRTGGPDDGELSLLRYPLFVGARWTMRESPRFARVVLGRERVIVPAGAYSAWHLRGLSQLYGPEDRVAFWYSSAGLVRTSFHFESVATDNAGNVIGRVLADQDQVLSALTLVDPNAPHTLAVTPVEGAEPR